MMPSMTDGKPTDNYEDNTNGEPDAMKVARPVRKGIERKGLVTVPRSQSTLHWFMMLNTNGGHHLRLVY